MKSKTIRIASWQNEIFGIMLKWIGGKILDFLWKKAKTILRLEGETRIKNRIFVMFGVDILMFLFNGLFYIPRKEDVSEYQDSVRRFLRLHRKWHQFSGKELCCVCLNIDFFKSHFANFVSEPQLYPPFNSQDHP